MSYADHIFINMCKDIIENGTSTEGEKVRPKWEDGTSAYTIKQFGVVNRYDLSKEFPALTLRRTAIKSCTDEMLWIWQQKSNNINDLHSHVWDEWADETGSIGKAYGYQMGVKHQYKEGMMDQVDRVIYDLKNNPYSRRIMTNIYVHADLHEMHLYPCAYSMTFNVTKKPGQDKLVLNAILNQRSQDILHSQVPGLRIFSVSMWPEQFPVSIRQKNTGRKAIIVHRSYSDSNRSPLSFHFLFIFVHFFIRSLKQCVQITVCPIRPRISDCR